MTVNELLSKIISNVIEGREDKNAPFPEEKVGAPGVKELTQQAVEQEIDVNEIINKGLLPGMKVVGEKFETGEFFLPDLLIAAKALQAGMGVLKQLLVKSKVKSLGKAAVGTVKGDMHDMGKTLVKLMFEGAGFEVIDLGIDVPKEKFINIIKEEKVQLLGMSSLLTTTMLEMGAVIKALKDEGLRNSVKVMVGGAPVTEQFAEKIEADGYAIDAVRAVARAKELLALK
jgi:5-methyltetrahydrofolate--homocysteine methyltransferase